MHIIRRVGVVKVSQISETWSSLQMQKLREAMKRMYAKSDEELLRLCGIKEKHYAASTSVTLLFWKDLICVGHLGDSRICLIYICNENLQRLRSGLSKGEQENRENEDDKKKDIWRPL